MKQLFIIIAFTIVLMFPLVAHADVVIGNDFFDKNRDKTEPLNHIFQVNSAKGFLSAKEKPGSLKSVGTYQNGNLLLIDSTYLHNGKYWGIPPVSHYGPPGWFPMDELLMFYSSVDFETENQASIYNYVGDLDSLLTAEEFYIWQWPGSDREKIFYDYRDLEESAVRTGLACLDDEGREWLYVRLWGGSTFGGGFGHIGAASGWVCLSDPGNGGIPAFNPAPEPIPWVYGEAPDWYGTADRSASGAAGKPAPESERYKPSVLLIIAICAVGALILIKKFAKKDKKGKERNANNG